MGKFRSRFEERVYETSLRGSRARYESLRIPFLKIHVYKPDWVLPNGIIVEAKGNFSPFDRSKHLLVKKAHPHLDIRFVFGADNKLHKNSKTRYSDWCAQHGFIYALLQVPPEWLLEPKMPVRMEQIKI